MKMSFRWFGVNDPIPLQYIRQIPSVKSIVSALYDVPVGEVWPRDKINSLKNIIASHGLEFTVIESIPVHEDIKLGRSTRDLLIANYCKSIENMGACGIPILCYNFMPVFDWTRSNLAMKLDDGSTALSYDDRDLNNINLDDGTKDLPGWAVGYSRAELKDLMDAYKNITEENLWENLSYFLKIVVPVAEKNNVRMGIHPDDPPWSIFGLPRIMKDEKSLERLISIVDSTSNGVTFCTGSLGPNSSFDMLSAFKKLTAKNRVPFVHMRNIKRTGEKGFYESSHITENGDVDMYNIMKIIVESGFDGAVRPDHGRMIWGETGKPGYGLYDRALGAMYLAGLYEGIKKSC